MVYRHEKCGLGSLLGFAWRCLRVVGVRNGLWDNAGRQAVPLLWTASPLM